MKRKMMPTEAVSSFFFYMWNAWSEDECKTVFGNMYRHFWNKWTSLASDNIYGAVERYYSELSDNNRELLVERAVSLYEGSAFRKPENEGKKRSRLLKEEDALMNELLESVKRTVSEQGGMIRTQKRSCDPIFSIEYLSLSDSETVGKIVVGLRVKDNDLQVYSIDDSLTARVPEVTEKDLADPEQECKWESLLHSDRFVYDHTIKNIAENIDQYVTKDENN